MKHTFIIETSDQITEGMDVQDESDTRDGISDQRFIVEFLQRMFPDALVCSDVNQTPISK